MKVSCKLLQPFYHHCHHCSHSEVDADVSKSIMYNMLQAPAQSLLRHVSRQTTSRYH